MKNLMIDLETLGTNPDCPVISLGAVFFDGTGLGERFYAVLDVEAQMDAGRKASASTIKWWMGQGDAAKKVFREGGQDTKTVLEEFSQFCVIHGAWVQPWSKGANFDIVIMEDLFRFYDLPVPWKYSQVRCFRTFEKTNCQGVNIPFDGVQHDALADALHQATIAVEGLKRMTHE